MENLCPCGSQKAFAACCEPLLLGTKKAETAEALMRARYTAYTCTNIDFLYATSTDKVRDDFDCDETRRWAALSQWHGLEILKTEDGEPQDDTGTVEFLARYISKDIVCRHHERASFVRQDGEWMFDEGFLINPEPVRRESPKVGRNDPCPCGSGKKYKKCCEKA